MREEDKEEKNMSIQSGLSIMDAYRNFVKEKVTKKELELVFIGDLRNNNRPLPTIEPESESKQKKRFGF